MSPAPTVSTTLTLWAAIRRGDGSPLRKASDPAAPQVITAISMRGYASSQAFTASRTDTPGYRNSKSSVLARATCATESHGTIRSA
ncbi:Uncharacterised protein [Mycobacteroides abscessus subsp. abscessus]|nr:Uncharacterised protein [Mycobacteroides abscessus subsp. abscessus]